MFLFQQPQYTHYRITNGSPRNYASFYAGANPTQYSKQKERVNIIMKDIEAFISSIGDEETSAKFKAALPGILSNVESTIANAANVPGSSNFEWLSDEEFAAYRERQNQIFKTSGDLSAQLSGLKFY